MKLFKLFYNYLQTRSVLKIRIKIKNDRNRVSWKRSRLDFDHAYFGGRGKKKSPSLVIKHRSVNAHELERRGETDVWRWGVACLWPILPFKFLIAFFQLSNRDKGCLMARTNLMSDHCPPVRLYSMREHGDEWRHCRHGAANYQSLLRNNKAKPLGGGMGVQVEEEKKSCRKCRVSYLYLTCVYTRV